MPEIRSGIAQTIAALTKLKIILGSKIILLRSLVMFIFLYSADIERKIQTVRMSSFRRLLGISYKDHISSEDVRSRIRKDIGPYEELVEHRTKTQNEVVWACHKSFGTCQDSPLGHCTGREK